MLIAKSDDPREIRNQMIHMLMTYQITSSYHASVKQDPDFEIFPFRFMLRLLLDRRIKFLGTNEIALFLLQVKHPDEYDATVSRILDWREKIGDASLTKQLTETMFDKHMMRHSKHDAESSESAKTYRRMLRDVANTFINNLSYMTELNYDSRKGIVSIHRDSQKIVDGIFKKYENVPFSRLYEYSEATFARRFGMRYDRQKASKKETAPMTPARKKLRNIANAIKVLRKEGGVPTGPDLLERVQEITNYPIDTIKKTLSENPDLDQPPGDDSQFGEHYLECAADGQKHAEFENLTRVIFTKMGFEVSKLRIPKTTREIDGLIINKDTRTSGLLECKGGGRYTFPVGDCDKMKHTYIKNFKKKRIGGIEYRLDFFVYVVGNRVSGLGNFKEIVRDTGTRGSVIYAQDLFRVYRMLKIGNTTLIKIWGLLKSNKHVTWNDLGYDSRD